MAKQFFSQKDTYNLLLLGVDRRDESWNGNSDVVLLVTVNKEKKTVYLTSFLRDLYADIPGVGVRKLNAACANGGPELTIQTLEENYHVEIDNYAMVDFNAMIDVVDALGGVDLEIDEDERVTANDYITCMCEDNGVDPKPYYIKKAGKVHLNGYQAVGYAEIVILEKAVILVVPSVREMYCWPLRKRLRTETLLLFPIRLKV